MPRRKLLLLDLAFHSHSKSTEFVLELLSRRFDVTRVYTDVGRDDLAEYQRLVAEHKPDILFFLQVYCSAEIMAAIGLPGIWMPMYDNVNKRMDDRFVDSARVGEPILAFCRAHSEIATYWKVPCLVVQYFPEPAPPPDFEAGNNRVLIWYRGGIQPAEIAPLISSIPGLSVVIKHDPDPPYADTPRADGDLTPFVERVIEGFLPKDEYNDLIASCGIYLAPRKAEGIGLSFLEAMARGALIIAYDAPTMNEYIEHGKTGWLFGTGHAEPLPGGSIASLRRASYEAVLRGRDLWKAREDEFLDFVDSAPRLTMRPSSFKVGVVRTLKRLKTVVKP